MANAQKRLGPILTIRRPAVRDRVVRGRKNPLCLQIGKRLKQLREAGGISQRRLAKASGIGFTTISMVEGELRLMEIDSVEQLAAALSVSPGWLAYGPESTVPFRQKRTRTGPAPVPSPKLIDLKTRSVRYEGCGARLQQLRKTLGITYQALEDASGISSVAIVNTENRTTVPKIQTLEAIAVALDVAPAWLAYGEGRPTELRPSRPDTAVPRRRQSASE